MSWGDVIYDVEAYPNYYCCGFQPISAPEDVGYLYEIRERRNDSTALYYAIRMCGRMIGFNNMHYDWPMTSHFLHLYAQHGKVTAEQMYAKNQEIFGAQKFDKFAHVIWRPGIPQIDMFMMLHLDRFFVSLKQCEATMRSELVYEQPIPPGTVLTAAQMDIIPSYNAWDIKQTRKLFKANGDAIAFRESMASQLGDGVINFNDGKIGKKFFERELIAAGVKLYEDVAPGEKAKKRQTYHPNGVRLADVVLPCVRFTRDASNRNLELIKDQLIMPDKTKGGFKTLFDFDGFHVDFKLGGAHGSIKRKIVTNRAGRVRDFDVPSFYPSLSIEHWIFPAHLGRKFCEVYGNLRSRRFGLSKKDPNRTTLKYALNVPFGDSNSKHGNSIFQDMAFLLAITISGQLTLCMLAEQFANAGIEIIQLNTDGITVFERPGQADAIDRITAWWMQETKMGLEETQYKFMAVKDANNYYAVKTDGEVKRVGDYDYEKTRLGKYWQSNHSMLVVPRAVEKVLMTGLDVESAVIGHNDPWDFLLFRKGKFEIDDKPTAKALRYYVSLGGGKLISIYPPLSLEKGPRRIGVHAEGQAQAIGTRKNYHCSACGAPFSTKKEFEEHNVADHGWKVTPALYFDGSFPRDIDYRYYISETKKLVFDEHL